MSQRLLLLFRLFSLLAAGTVSSTIPVLAARLECSLEVPRGYPVPDNARVDLSMASGSQLESAVAQANGHVTFERIAAGKYTISVRADGYLPTTQDVEVPSGYIGSSIFNVMIRLTPEPQPEGRPKGEKTVSLEAAVSTEAQ